MPSRRMLLPQIGSLTAQAQSAQFHMAEQHYSVASLRGHGAPRPLSATHCHVQSALACHTHHAGYDPCCAQRLCFNHTSAQHGALHGRYDRQQCLTMPKETTNTLHQHQLTTFNPRLQPACASQNLLPQTRHSLVCVFGCMTCKTTQHATL